MANLNPPPSDITQDDLAALYATAVASYIEPPNPIEAIPEGGEESEMSTRGYIKVYQEDLSAFAENTRDKLMKIHQRNQSDYQKALLAKKKEEEEKRNPRLFDQLVLPEADKELIQATIAQSREDVRKKIFIEWGFDETIEKGKGMILLFYGPPGTGKTMCAEGVANLLGKDHALISNDQIQSSIPGRTEAQIKQLFKNAKQKDLVMIFDECDSFVYNRDEVGAILAAEVNCLLTEIERFEGVCILTTNRGDCLDTALERRISLKLEFAKPKKEARERIWKNIIPKKAPIHNEVLMDRLADNELTGGQIKNAMLIAARLAATSGKKSIEVDDFTNGIKREIDGAKAFKRSNRFSTRHMGEMISGAGHIIMDRNGNVLQSDEVHFHHKADGTVEERVIRRIPDNDTSKDSDRCGTGNDKQG